MNWTGAVIIKIYDCLLATSSVRTPQHPEVEVQQVVNI